MGYFVCATQPWPTLDDTSNKGSQGGEGKKVDDEVDPELGAKVWKACKFKSGMIRVPYELIERPGWRTVIRFPERRQCSRVS